MNSIDKTTLINLTILLNQGVPIKIDHNSQGLIKTILVNMHILL